MAKYTNRERRNIARGILFGVLVSLAQNPTLPYAYAASSWNPTVLVNTEAFEIIDETDAVADPTLQFGPTLAKKLTYERTAGQFRFDDDLEVVGTASGVHIHASNSLTSSGTLVWEGAGSGASLHVSNGFGGSGLIDCDSPIISKILWDATDRRFSCGTDQTMGGGSTLQDAYDNDADGSDAVIQLSALDDSVIVRNPSAGGADSAFALQIDQAADKIGLDIDSQATTQAGLRIDIDGDSSSPHILFGYASTFDTNLFRSAANTLRTSDSFIVDGSVGIGTTDLGEKLEVSGTASGIDLYATRALRSSGSLVWEGAGSGATLTVSNGLRGSGLISCSNSTTDKLLWNSATGRFSCGTDQTSAGGSGLDQTAADARYINQSGDTMTGALTINKAATVNGTALTAYEQVSMMSGATLSGSLLLQARNHNAKPLADQVALYNREWADRGILFFSNRNGTPTPLQSSFMGNNICLIRPSATTVINNLGCGTTNTATLSHPVPTEALPYATNFATSATSGNESGYMTTIAQYFRGSVSGFNGFFFKARVIPIDTTLVRTFVGLTSQTTLALTMASDDTTGHRAAFAFSTVRGDTNWQLTLKDNVTQNLVNTGVPFTASNVYDLIMWAPSFGSPNAGTVYWEVINLTSGVRAAGSTSSNLPGGSTALRGVLGVETQTTAAKSFRMVNWYTETDAKIMP